MYHLLENGLIVSDESEFVYIFNNKASIFVIDKSLKKYVMRGSKTRYVMKHIGKIIKSDENFSKLWDFKNYFVYRGELYGCRKL